MKYTKLCWILLLCIASKMMYAQDVKVLNYKVTGSEILINYKIDDTKFNQKFDAVLYVSFDNGKTYQGPMKSVRGDVTSVRGGNNKLVWNPFKDVPSMEGDIEFDVRVFTIEEEIKKHFYIAYSAGIPVSNMDYLTPIGIQLGMLGKTGFYLAARFNGFTSSDYIYDGTLITDYSSGSNYYEFTDQTAYPRFSVTGGITKQLGWNMYLYGGVGYGYKKLLWHIKEFDYATATEQGDAYVDYEEYSVSGVEAEAGLIIRMNIIALNIGVKTLQFSDVGLTAGLGFNF